MELTFVNFWQDIMSNPVYAGTCRDHDECSVYTISNMVDLQQDGWYVN